MTNCLVKKGIIKPEHHVAADQDGVANLYQHQFKESKRLKYFNQAKELIIKFKDRLQKSQLKKVQAEEFMVEQQVKNEFVQQKLHDLVENRRLLVD